eukprot:16114_1
MVSKGAENYYYISRCLWFIPWSILLCLICRHIYRELLSRRRYKYGIHTNATITKKWKQMGEGEDTSYYFYIQYKFDDKRAIITNQCMKILIQKLIPKDSNIFLPNDIITLCVEYIGTVFIFWYGPYYVTTRIDENVYDMLYQRDDINISYDPKYPHNAIILFDNKSEKRSHITFIISTIVLCGIGISLIYGLISTIDFDQRFPIILLIIFGISIPCAISIIIWTCSKNKSFCFEEDKKSKLQCDYCLEPTCELANETSSSTNSPQDGVDDNIINDGYVDGNASPVPMEEFIE